MTTLQAFKGIDGNYYVVDPVGQTASYFGPDAYAADIVADIVANGLTAERVGELYAWDPDRPEGYALATAGDPVEPKEIDDAGILRVIMGLTGTL